LPANFKPKGMKKYTVSIHGYGSEITIGSVTDEQKSILLNEDKDLVEIVQEDLDEYGAYYEIDNQYHRWGATDHYTITIEDEEGNTVFEVDEENIYDHDTDDFELVEFVYPEINEGLDLLVTVATEKGSFFLGNIETEFDFDLSKLKIKIDSDIELGEYSFGQIVSSIFYDGEEVDNYGGDTNGKSFEVYKNF
jgi:hypothetical protein